MRMLFRSFNGYDDCDSGSPFTRPARDNTENRYTLADLGKELVYSEKIRMNIHCLLGSDKYTERCLNDVVDWRKTLQECIDFASGFDVIGFVTFPDEENKSASILTANAYTNVYSCIKGCDSFFIVFNARPIRYTGYDKSVTIGYDKYAFEFDRKSIIVWNLDKFANLPFPEDFTVWGIRQDTGGESVTDDVMVGIRGQKMSFV